MYGHLILKLIVLNPQKLLMDKFQKETLPKLSQYLENILDKNPKDEVYCVGNKVRSDVTDFIVCNKRRLIS